MLDPILLGKLHRRARTAVFCAAAAAALSILLFPAAALAWPGSVQLDLQSLFGAHLQALAGTQFSGSGTLSATHQPATFHATGAELGIAEPWQAVIGLRMYVIIGRYLGIGFGGQFPVLGGADAPPSRPDLAAQVDTRQVDGYRIEGEVAGILPLGRFSLRLGLDVGYRKASVQLSSFDPTPCGKGGMCAPPAEQSGPTLGPRLWFTAPVFSGSQVNALVYMGADLLEPLAFSAGIGMSGTIGLW